MPTLAEELEEIRAAERSLEARKHDVYRRSLEAPEAEKAMTDWMAQMCLNHTGRDAELHGWQVDALSWGDGDELLLQRNWNMKGPGPHFVAIRPCEDQFKGKTYLGVLIGDFPLSISASFNRETKVLDLQPARHNPMIYIPDLGTVVFGAESWWGSINSPEQLRKITDADIESIWYVRALKALDEKPGEQAEAEPSAESGASE